MSTTTPSTAVPPSRSAIQTLDITVLMGGPSDEREVSLKSGAAVAEALARLGHRVFTADIDPADLTPLAHPADLVFIALHGTFGEDGQLQAVLEQRGIPYIGSDANASRLAMNKVNAKTRFVAAGLPTPRFELVMRGQARRTAEAWPLPAVVKPVDQGSSIDTAIVRDRATCADRLEHLVATYGAALIEEYIEGPELTVGILGNRALPVCEIRTPREFYDYAAKYLEDTTEYSFDIGLPPAVLEEVQTLSLKAHRVLGCREFSRVDWMISARTHQPYLLEVNTIPGFTDHSLLPKAAARIGMSFDSLCQAIVELARGRALGGSSQAD